MTNIFQKLISIVFHPLLLPTYTVLYFFIAPSYLNLYPTALKQAILLMIFLSSFIAPMLFILILYNLNKISTIQIYDAKERHIPFIISFIFNTITFLILLKLPIEIPSIILCVFVVVNINLLIVLFLNRNFKISTHMIGMGGMVGYLFIFHVINNIEFVSPLCILLLLAGVVGTSRLKLNIHNSAQIYSGFLLGLISGLCSIFIVFI